MTKSYNDPLYHVDFNSLQDGIRGNGVKAQFVILEDSPQSMNINVSAGTAWVDQVEYIESVGMDLAIAAAHATLPRRDIVIYDTSATNPAVITGTPGTEPIPPHIPSGDILLAVINIAAGVTVITNSDIDDGRTKVVSHVHQHLAGGIDELSYYDIESSSILHANDPHVTPPSSSYTKVKEISIAQCSDTIRIYFAISTGQFTTIGAQVYRNGVAVGTAQSIYHDGSEGHYQNISGWNDGDLLQLYAYKDGPNPGYAYNFRIYGTNVVFYKPTTGCVNQ